MASTVSNYDLKGSIEMLKTAASRGRFARWTFWVLAAFCLWITWVPARDSLTRERGLVTLVHPHRAWVDVEITTESGTVVQCSGKSWSKRCPEEAFLRLRQSGLPVTVWHKGGKPYEVVADGKTIIDYADHRDARNVMFLVVLMLVAMGFVAGRQRESE